MTTTPTASPELLDLDHLEALARAATPGPWAYQEDSDVYTHIVRPVRSPGNIVRHYAQDTSGVVEANARFTGGANPAAVLALIALARRARPEGEAAPAEPFQQRVQPWMMACFGDEISADKVERNDRFTEESLELGQACGMTKDRVLALVDYVYDRPLGEPAQEVGGVMVTLAALCLAQGLDMHNAAEVELARIWTKVEAIRAKQLTKPRGSPLPVAAPRQAAAQKPAHGHRDDYYLLANGRRLGLEPISRVRNMPNWVLAMELFATGSGSAYQICRDAGVDPEGTTIERAAQLDGDQEGSGSNG